MENIITRGTTASLSVDFSEITDFTVSDIVEACLAVTQRGKTTEYGLDDMEIDGDVVRFHWTQEQTLAYSTGDNLSLDFHVTAKGQRYKINGVPSRVTVENTRINRVMET